MSGLLSGVLPAIYSAGDSAKRRLRGLLSDPVGEIQQTMGKARDDLNSVGELQRQAFSDPKQPLKVTNPQAFGLLADKYMNSVMNFAPVGMTGRVADAIYPRQEALETARINGVKMLGLPENNTPMDRAKALGYVDAFHGTSDDISKLDPSKFGSSTEAQSAKKAFWAVSEPSTARGYAEYSATQAPVKKLLSKAEKFEKLRMWDKYDDLIGQAEALETKFGQEPLQGQNIMPLMVRVNKGVRGAQLNANGAEFVDVEGGINNFLSKAVREGRDVAVINNLADDVGFNGRPATHFAAINPSVVRSRFAAFDPARVNDNDLLGRASLPMLGLLGAGSAGAAYLLRDKEQK